LREPGEGLGEEAIRALASSPKWMPGIQNGHPVKVQYTVPINFSLNTNSASVVRDTLVKKVMGFTTQMRVSRGGSDPIVIISRDSVPRHMVQSVMYLRHDALDTAKTIYIVNGKEISPQELSRIAPATIKEMQVYKTMTDEKSKKAKVTITLKDQKQDQ